MEIKGPGRESAGDWKITFRLDRDYEMIGLPQELTSELGYEGLEQLLYYAGTSLLFSLDTEDVSAFRLFVERSVRGEDAEPCFARLRTRDGRSLWYVFSRCGLCGGTEQKIASCRCRSLSGDFSLREYLQKEEARLRRLRTQLMNAPLPAGDGEGGGLRQGAVSRPDDPCKNTAWEGLPHGCMEQLIDSLPCGMLICEYWPDIGHITVRFFNDTFCRLTGCSTGELKAFRSRQIFTELVAEDKSGALGDEIHKMCVTGRGLNREVRLKRTEHAQWVRVTASAARCTSESFLLKFALLDISKEKRAEERVSFRDYCLQRLNESLFFGILVKELGLDAKPLYMSANVEQYLKKLVPDMESSGTLRYADLIHPQDYPAVQAMAARCSREELSSYELEFRLRMEDGHYCWIKMLGRRLRDFGAEHPYLLTFFDISSVKSAQEQLRIREEEYRIAVLHSNDIIVRMNMADRTIYVPKEVAERYHMPEKVQNMPDALIEKGCIQPESIRDYLEFYEKIRRGENCTVELRSRWFGSQIYWFRGVATVITGEKKEPLSAVISFTDITAQKQMVTELETLEESEKMLEMIVSSSSKMILKYHFDGNVFVPISPPAREIFSRIPGRNDPETLISPQYIAQETLQDAKRFFDGLRSGVPQSSVNIKARTRDHGWRWYNCLHVTSFSQEGAPRYALLFCEDITNKRSQELASIRLRDYTENGDRKILFHLEYNLTLDAFEGSEGVIPPCYQQGFTGSYTRSTRRFLEDVLPPYRESFRLMFEKERLIAALKQGKHSGTQELQILYEGEPLWVRAFYQILKDPYTSFINIWISCIDIHAEKQSELRLMEMANLDPVTGIYNRAAFEHYVAESCAAAEGGSSGALIMLDVDGFGRVNDALGHACGDKLLRDIANTLRMAAGTQAMAARVGGDEFAICSNDVSDISQVKEWLRIILAAVCREAGPGVSVSISAGAAIYLRDGKRFEELYRKADLALYHAKMAGRNRYRIYDETMAEMPAGPMTVPADPGDPAEHGIYIRTFGFFEVFIHGEPLLIQNAKAKELLALLVDRRGAFVSQGDIISCLWENETVNKVTLARLRKTAMLLRNALREYQCEDLIESRKGLRRVDTKRICCDLYQYLSHKPEYRHLYRGAYMANYSWGELTIDELERERADR